MNANVLRVCEVATNETAYFPQPQNEYRKKYLISAEEQQFCKHGVSESI